MVSNYSNTTKYNLLHTLRELKTEENLNGFVKEGWDTWDEYDLQYLIELVEKDIS